MLVLTFVCVLVVVTTSAKNSKLIREHRDAKKDYLSARAVAINLDAKYSEVSNMCKELTLKCNEVNEKYLDVSKKFEYVNIKMEEQDRRIKSLESDNKRLKTLLRIKDESAPTSKVLPIR